MKRILGRAFSPSLVVSAIALSVALGGGAWAAAAGQQARAIPARATVRCVTVPSSAFKNGWQSVAAGGFHKVQICKDSLGYIHLTGLLAGGTANATAFFLPRADRPRFNHAFAVAAGTGAPVTEDVNVFRGGAVFLFGPATDAVVLDGVTFHVGG